MRSVRRSGRTERRPNQREGTCDHETDTTTNVSVDGVMQGPGGPDEDRRGGFERGGWAMPLFDGEAATFLYEVYQRADAFLFGPNRPLTPRKTIAQTIAQAAIDGARAPPSHGKRSSGAQLSKPAFASHTEGGSKRERDAQTTA